MRMQKSSILSMMESQETGLSSFFVNNNTSFDVGGTHWSLLVLDNNTKIFHHFDSSGQMNGEVAEKFANSIATSFGWMCLPMQRPRCQQQSAIGNDCGIHALKFCEALSNTTSWEIGIREASKLRFCASKERKRIFS